MASKMVDYKDSPYESKEQYGVRNSSRFDSYIEKLKGINKEL